MGSLSQALYKVGIKGDLIGHASAPNMVIPPPTDINIKQTNDDDNTASTMSTQNNSDISIRVSDDGQDQDQDQDGQDAGRRSSVHPGNSVWLAHSF